MTLIARSDASDSRPNLSVLYVAEAFGGGLMEITRMQAEAIARRGHRVCIAYGVRPETPDDPRLVIDNAVELVQLPWAARSAGEQIRAAFALRRLCQHWQPDVVHLMSSFAGLHGVLALRDVTKVYTPQGYAFTMSSESRVKRWAYLLLEDFVARHVDVVGACSVSEGEQARSLPGARSVCVIENGIEELDSKATVAFPSRAPVAVAIGRPSPQRRPEACARILSAVSDLAEVRWIGGGPDSPGLRALVGASVSVSGWLPRDETLRALSEATLYLHWTAWDGLPLSVLEAIARDVVVVASDIGPNREILGPEQVCHTEEDAIRLMRAILCDPDLRSRLLAKQRERRTWYSADRMVGQWLDLYTSLVDA